MQRTLILVLFLLLAGSAFRVAPRAGGARELTTLLVLYNEPGKADIFYAASGGPPQRIGEVVGFRPTCMRLPKHLGPLGLLLVRPQAIRGLVPGPAEDFSASAGWQWTIEYTHAMSGMGNLMHSAQCALKTPKRRNACAPRDNTRCA